MARALVIYASTHGHTGKIAARLAADLRAAGLETDCRDVADSEGVSVEDYDAVVAGASLHVEKHQPEIVEWVKQNRAQLEQRPSAFFSVSLTAAEDTAEAREATAECLQRFLEQTGWRPEATTTVAGCLQYTSYGRLLRFFMRVKMKRGGHPTDTSRDHEYTDWDALADFAAGFAARVAQGSPAAPQHS